MSPSSIFYGLKPSVLCSALEGDVIQSPRKNRPDPIPTERPDLESNIPNKPPIILAEKPTLSSKILPYDGKAVRTLPSSRPTGKQLNYYQYP